MGGQRTQKRKWLRFFDGVRAVLFLVDVSRYDLRPRQGSATVRHITAASRVNIRPGAQNHGAIAPEGQAGKEKPEAESQLAPKFPTVDNTSR